MASFALHYKYHATEQPAQVEFSCTSTDAQRVIDAQQERIDELSEILEQTRLQKKDPVSVAGKDIPTLTQRTSLQSRDLPPRRVSKDSLMASGLNESDAAVVAEMLEEAYASHLERLNENRKQERVFQAEIREWLLTNVGEHAYDSYLFATAQRNRVIVREIPEGTLAELEGLRKKDMVHSIDGKRIFRLQDIQDLQNQSPGPDYFVDVLFVREDHVFSVYLPLNNLGIRLGAARTNPGSFPLD